MTDLLTVEKVAKETVIVVRRKKKAVEGIMKELLEAVVIKVKEEETVNQ